MAVPALTPSRNPGSLALVCAAAVITAINQRALGKIQKQKCLVLCIGIQHSKPKLWRQKPNFHVYNRFANYCPRMIEQSAPDQTQRKLIIAIDGPAGAGKSTIASRLARKLGYVNLESGAMYRALALKAIDRDVSFDDEATLLKLAQDSRIQLEPTMGGNRTLLNGHDISARIRERDVTEGASRVSVHPGVRAWMVARQRELGAGGGVVMEGRDIGTKVFPDADLKIFLDADPVVREQRRMEQQKIKGTVAANVAADLRERDLRDRTRAASPLVAAQDAVLIDSTSLSETEVLQKVEELAANKLHRRS
jgi:CMP/dCMP kinase